MDMPRRTVLEGIATNAALSVAIGAPWAAGVSAKSTHGGDVARWDAFEIVTGDTIVAAAKVAGQPARGILDSGSGATILSSDLAARLGLAGDARTISGLAAKTGVTLVKDVVVELAGLPRALPFVIVGDLSAVSRTIGQSVDLVLGTDLFIDRCVAIDFGRRRYSLSPSGTFQGGAGWKVLPVSRGDKQELLTLVTLPHGGPMSMMVDTGNSNALIVSQAVLQDRALAEGRPQSSALIAGVDGVQTAGLVTIDGVQFGGLTLDGIPSIAMPRWLPARAVGNVGLPLIAQFDVVFDISSSRLWVRPLRKAQRLPLLKDRSGLGLQADRSALVVVHVARGSPAARDDWVVGTRIVAVNGQRINGGYTHGQLWKWRFDRPGTVVKLLLDTGRIVPLELEDYY